MVLEASNELYKLPDLAFLSMFPWWTAQRCAGLYTAVSLSSIRWKSGCDGAIGFNVRAGEEQNGFIHHHVPL